MLQKMQHNVKQVVENVAIVFSAGFGVNVLLRIIRLGHNSAQPPLLMFSALVSQFFYRGEAEIREFARRVC